MQSKKTGTVETWGDVVDLVQKANINQMKNIKWQSNHRKMAYKNQLDLQVEQHLRSSLIQHQRKNREKTELQQSVNHDKIQMNLKKIKKLKTQQQLQQQNLSLFKNTKNNQFKSAKTSTIQQSTQNPFVSLVDQQDIRKKQTILNFKLQNKLNNIQIQIKNKRNFQQVENNKIMREQYENYVKNQFETIDKQRQKFKSKYLALRNWQKQRIKSRNGISSSSIQKSYIQFLDTQAQELKHKYKQRSSMDVINPIQSKINQQASTPNSSPAYLGRIPFSDDRRKQLSMLDQQLFHGTKNLNIGNSNNSGKSKKDCFLYRSVDITPSNNRVENMNQSKFRDNNREMERLQNLNTKLKSSLQKQTELPVIQKRSTTVLQKTLESSPIIKAPSYFLSNPQVKSKPISNPKIAQKQQKISNHNSIHNPTPSSNPSHSPRSFMRFDVIAGCNKIIVI